MYYAPSIFFCDNFCCKYMMWKPSMLPEKVSRHQNQILACENIMELGASLCCHTKYGSLGVSGVSGARCSRQMEFS